jgi:hypothetical protein
MLPKRVKIKDNFQSNTLAVHFLLELLWEHFVTKTLYVYQT